MSVACFTLLVVAGPYQSCVIWRISTTNKFNIYLRTFRHLSPSLSLPVSSISLSVFLLLPSTNHAFRTPIPSTFLPISVIPRDVDASPQTGHRRAR